MTKKMFQRFLHICKRNIETTQRRRTFVHKRTKKIHAKYFNCQVNHDGLKKQIICFFTLTCGWTVVMLCSLLRLV